jgi:hypothetical protein
VRKLCLIVLFVTFSVLEFRAQTPATPATPPPPQSARQALLEMFLGKGENDFTKHLPDDARHALIHKDETPETNMILRISMIGREITSQGEHVETFETGPTILGIDITQNNRREKIEVNVEHDSLMGEDDEIELSVHYYKNGELQSLPVIPRLTFTFRQEEEVWRLIEVTAAAHMPLTDPDYLKGLRKQQDEDNEAQAKMRLSIIAGAEGSYTARHPDLGYSCSLSSLFAQDPGEAPGQGTVPSDPGQGSADWNGYGFALTGCDGSPASKYRVTAVPNDPDAGLKTFCVDESQTMKFVVGGKASGCFSHGKPVSPDSGTD